MLNTKSARIAFVVLIAAMMFVGFAVVASVWPLLALVVAVGPMAVLGGVIVWLATYFWIVDPELAAKVEAARKEELRTRYR